MIANFTATLDSATRPHTHNVHEFIVGMSGEALVRVGDRRYPINSRSSILIPAGITHHYEAGDETQAAIAFTCFDNEALKAMTTPTLIAGLRRALDSGVSASSLSRETGEENATLVGILKSALADNNSFSQEKAENLLSTLLANHLLAAGSSNKLPHPARLENLKRLVQQIDHNVSEELSIDAAAQRCCMSRSVFTRAFKSYTSLSFNNYLTRARLRHAAQLLLRDALAIDDVANRSGYRNLGHFYRQFQTQFGMTPKEYRRVAIDMQSPGTREQNTAAQPTRS